jgi:hypothetical protein
VRGREEIGSLPSFVGLRRVEVGRGIRLQEVIQFKGHREERGGGSGEEGKGCWCKVITLIQRISSI